jgi:hypothetical protein
MCPHTNYIYFVFLPKKSPARTPYYTWERDVADARVSEGCEKVLELCVAECDAAEVQRPQAWHALQDAEERREGLVRKKGKKGHRKKKKNKEVEHME